MPKVTPIASLSRVSSASSIVSSVHSSKVKSLHAAAMKKQSGNQNQKQKEISPKGNDSSDESQLRSRGGRTSTGLMKMMDFMSVYLCGVHRSKHAKSQRILLSILLMVQIFTSIGCIAFAAVSVMLKAYRAAIAMGVFAFLLLPNVVLFRCHQNKKLLTAVFVLLGYVGVFAFTWCTEPPGIVLSGGGLVWLNILNFVVVMMDLPHKWFYFTIYTFAYLASAVCDVIFASALSRAEVQRATVMMYLFIFTTGVQLVASFLLVRRNMKKQIKVAKEIAEEIATLNVEEGKSPLIDEIISKDSNELYEVVDLLSGLAEQMREYLPYLPESLILQAQNDDSDDELSEDDSTDENDNQNAVKEREAARARENNPTKKKDAADEMKHSIATPSIASTCTSKDPKSTLQKSTKLGASIHSGSKKGKLGKALRGSGKKDKRHSSPTTNKSGNRSGSPGMRHKHFVKEGLKLKANVVALHCAIDDFDRFYEGHKILPLTIGKLHSVYVDTISRVVSQHGGVVHDFDADLVKCSFGGTKRCFEAEKRAVLAAMAIQEQLKQETEFLKFPRDVQVRMGITVGKARCGNLGGRLKRWSNVAPHFRSATALLQVAREEDISIALTGSVAQACKNDMICEIRDVVCLPPRGRKATILTPVEKKEVKSDEWFYELEAKQNLEEDHLSYQINKAWKHFCNGRPARAARTLDEIKDTTPNTEKLRRLLVEYGDEGGSYNRAVTLAGSY